MSPSTTLEPALESKLLSPGDAVAEKVVQAFSRRARVVGIRSIAMADLAKELRVSTKTLYKYFRNKGDLVHELVVRWESRIHQPSGYTGTDLLERLRHAIDVWAENDAQFSTAFWLDLKSDYPRLYQVYMNFLHNRMEAMQKRLTPYLKPELDPGFAWSSYVNLMAASKQPKNFEKIGMTREQCIHASFEFWLNGAIDLQSLRTDQEQERKSA